MKSDVRAGFSFIVLESRRKCKRFPEFVSVQTAMPGKIEIAIPVGIWYILCMINFVPYWETIEFLPQGAAFG